MESMNPLDLAERWSDGYKLELSGDSREIARAAGEAAGFPDDAFDEDFAPRCHTRVGNEYVACGCR